MRKDRKSSISLTGKPNVAARLTILDVGHGSCAVLEAGEIVVIDVGPSTTCLEYLRERAIAKISQVLLSHADADHLQGLLSMVALGSIRIGSVRVNTDAAKGSGVWTALAWELDAADRKRRLQLNVALTEGDTLVVDSRSRLVVLAPRKYLALLGPGSKDAKGRRIHTNTVSAVIRYEYDGEAVALLPGDLDALGLEYLLETRQDLHAKLLVYPHHGGHAGAGDAIDEDFAKRLCSAVRPELIVFSIGRGRSGTPRPNIVAAIRRELPGVRIACTQLSEHCAERLPLWQPTHLANAYAAGRQKNRCCAGSLVIELSEGKGISPTAGEHRQFILRAAPTALCMSASRPEGQSAEPVPND